MIDIGVNLTHPSLLQNLSDNIKLWEQEGVKAVVAIASDLQESNELQKISQSYKNKIWHTIGCHPHEADNWVSGTSMIQAKSLIVDSNLCVAVGETGLDFNRNYSSQENQITAFQEQVQLALELSLPLYLHERDAEDTLLSILHNHDTTQIHGVLHCFTGSPASLKRYLDLGLYIGITGWLCDERRGQALQEAITYIPHDRILLETDAPYLLPRHIRPRPKKNHPKYLPQIVEYAADLMGLTPQELGDIAIENSQALFRLDKQKL